MQDMDDDERTKGAIGEEIRLFGSQRGVTVESQAAWNESPSHPRFAGIFTGEWRYARRAAPVPEDVLAVDDVQTPGNVFGNFLDRLGAPEVNRALVFGRGSSEAEAGVTIRSSRAAGSPYVVADWKRTAVT